MTQSSVPSPDNPVTPQETGDRTAQLWDEQTLAGYYASNGSFAATDTQLCTKNKIRVTPNTQYFLGVPSRAANQFLAVSTYDAGGAFIERHVLSAYTGDGVQYTTNANTHFININFSTYYGATYANNIMITQSATVQPYALYGYKIPITLAGQTSPIYLSEPIRKIGDYSDSVASDEMTNRTIKKRIFTGLETWSMSSGVLYTFAITDFLYSDGVTCVCTHYEAQANANGVGGVQEKKVCFRVSQNHQFYLKDSTFTTTDELKSWLSDEYAAGHPFTVWYVLETPTTESFTAPTLTPAKGSNTLSIGTTLQPSEVSITGHVKQI